MLSGEEAGIVALSLRVAIASVVASLPFAVGAAWVLARCRFRGKVLFDAIVHLPLVLPPVVVGYALLIAFGRQGPLGEIFERVGVVFAFRWTGAAIAAAVMAFPLLVRAIRLSMEAVDQRLERAGRTLGAGPWHIF